MTTVQQRPNWPAIQQAAIAGVPYADLSKRFGVTHAAIKKQSQRNRWPVPNRILKRARELSPVVPGDAVDTAAENWLAHGQAANGFALRILRAKLERAASKLDSIADLADVEDIATAAKMARICAGLDSAVMVNLQQHQHAHIHESPALALLASSLRMPNCPPDASTATPEGKNGHQTNWMDADAIEAELVHVVSLRDG